MRWPIITISGGDIELVHSFQGGPKTLQPHESEIVFVYLKKVEGQELWRLRTRVQRHENRVISILHSLRFQLSDYMPIKVPRWDSANVVTEWISE
jgi:hypothetical protein